MATQKDISMLFAHAVYCFGVESQDCCSKLEKNIEEET